MSLETQLAAAVAATNALTNTVAGKVAEWDATLTAAIAELNAWKDTIVWESGLTVNVGPGLDYDTLQEALDDAARRQIRGPVTIQLPAGGVTLANGYTMQHQPWGALVRIKGNPAAPAGYPITCTAGGFAVVAGGLWLDGVKLVTAAPINLLTASAAGRAVASDCQFTGADIAVLAQFGGLVELVGTTTITNCLKGLAARRLGNIASSGGGLTITGRGVADAGGYGINADDNGFVLANTATVEQVYSGVVATGRGAISASTLTCRNTVIGAYAYNGGHIDLRSGTAPASRVTFASLRGLLAKTAGMIAADNVEAEDTEYGFFADTAGVISAPFSKAVRCSGYGYRADSGGRVFATGSSAYAASNGTNYYSTSGTTTANGGLMIYS